MKEKLNEVYVVNQPTHAIMSIVFIGSNKYPLSSEVHNNLYELSKFSDIFFIFSGTGIRGINPDKFCNLYSGCSWLISSRSLVEAFRKVGEYDINIFKNHTGYLVFSCIEDIGIYDFNEENKEKIRSANAGGSTNPFLVMSRLDSDSLFEIYSKPSSFSSWLNRPVNKDDKKYSIWTSTSKIIFLRPSNISKFLTLDDKYCSSFSWNDIRYFIASGIERLGMEHNGLNIIEEPELNDTKGKK